MIENNAEVSLGIEIIYDSKKNMPLEGICDMGFKARQDEIIRLIANAAQDQPLLSSGLWFHHDIRDNFYYASYLFAAALEAGEKLPFEASAAKQKAEGVLLEVLQLQDRNESSATYGHWPLNLGEDPRQAAPHPLPVELMGSLMAFFASRYSGQLSEALASAFDTALLHVYRSGFYRQANTFGHHDAKYTAAKLIFGQRFADAELLGDGHANLRLTLAHVRKEGMSEYSSLPWFWHWVQAFTCAWHMLDDRSIQLELADLLDYLWCERADFYLKGTWAGAHCRGQKHDTPLDGNVLFDYVQFGDFELPLALPRTEYAGFLYYKAPEHALRKALDRSQPSEVKKTVIKRSEAGAVHLHSYAYVTADFAAGGMWERYEEFDNEQHRWDITLPLGQQNGVNQAYFFHPSDPNAAEDARHQTGHTEVLFHKNAIAALYPLPEHASHTIIGVLPKADWQEERGLLLAKVGTVYLAAYLMQPYVLEQLSDRCLVISEAKHNGVVIEAISETYAEENGIADFAAFQEKARKHVPLWSIDLALGVNYTTWDGTALELTAGRDGTSTKIINGQAVDFSGYLM
jgi:hypothetical protein